LVAWTAANLWQYERFVDDVTGRMVSAEYTAQKTISGVPAMVMSPVKPKAINYSMFAIPFATNGAKISHIPSWWSEEIARIDPAQRNSDPAGAHISVVTKSSQQLFSILTLCIRLLRRSLAPRRRWFTAARPQSTLFMDFEHSRLERSGKW